MEMEKLNVRSVIGTLALAAADPKRSGSNFPEKHRKFETSGAYKMATWAMMPGKKKKGKKTC